jgi:hypothetical protein
VGSIIALGAPPPNMAGSCRSCPGMGGASWADACGTGSFSRNDTLRRILSVLRRAGAVPTEHVEADADVDGRRVPIVDPEAQLVARNDADADNDAILPSGDVLPTFPPVLLLTPRGNAGSPTPLSGLNRLKDPAAVRGRGAACEDEEAEEPSVTVERLGRKAGARVARLAAFRW